jgi:hypothetical protein
MSHQTGEAAVGIMQHIRFDGLNAEATPYKMVEQSPTMLRSRILCRAPSIIGANNCLSPTRQLRALGHSLRRLNGFSKLMTVAASCHHGTLFAKELLQCADETGGSQRLTSYQRSAKDKSRHRRNYVYSRNSSSALSQTLNPVAQQLTTRQQEDIAGRQLIQALQSGDLAGAQKAYDKLAAFGPNSAGNSGPFHGQLATEFQAVGQALQAGDLAGAQTEATTLGNGLISSDINIVKQQQGQPGEQQAIANLDGDWWALHGQTPPPATTSAPASSGGVTNSAASVNLLV